MRAGGGTAPDENRNDFERAALAYGMHFAPTRSRRCRHCRRGGAARIPAQRISMKGSRLNMSNNKVEEDNPLTDALEAIAQEIPHGVDRRRFLMRTAVGGAAAVMTGCAI